MRFLQFQLTGFVFHRDSLEDARCLKAVGRHFEDFFVACEFSSHFTFQFLVLLEQVVASHRI